MGSIRTFFPSLPGGVKLGVKALLEIVCWGTARWSSS
ncbi:unnamed protein product [Tenebrio molitor]|nr:unnamed protein product [Tenebrio molitor]